MGNNIKFYDIAFLGHYTKDTIVSSTGTRIVDGGAFNYGANVATRMGLKVAAVTHLAKEDFHVVEKLKDLDVDVFVKITPQSTCLRLEYPTSNVDERVIYVTSSAGPFTPTEVEKIQARAFVVGASMREEVSLEVIKELAKKKTILAADVQSFIRVNDNGKLVPKEWPEEQAVLALLDILKTDAVEAEMLTGTSDIREAVRKIADLGPREVVITHRNGLLVYADGKFYEEKFFPKEIRGRSGRGDTCIASYAAKRLNTSPQEATIWAAAVTSLKMEAEGPFQQTIKEVDNLILSKYKN
ncbi:MAG: PfkB family carbohydrate kinase [Candidatus Caldatribacteriota bacterium]|nr:PfkB family carbohydrate kinase [Candidatus Caldatribacteriota bacterium]